MKRNVLAEMDGVREYIDGDPVEFVRRQQNGRLVIRAYNEGGNNHTDIDFMDLVEWLRHGPRNGVLKHGKEKAEAAESAAAATSSH